MEYLQLMSICESCNIEKKEHVVATPFAAYSGGVCTKCLDQEIYPLWLIKSEVSSIGGYSQCDDWFKQIIDKNLEFRSIDLDDFEREVRDIRYR